MGDKIPPRKVPDRDSKYMAKAWVEAGFSKDPSTQCGAVIVNSNNKPLGSGYNGPPRIIDDDSFSWERPPKDDPEAFSKYDVIRHAEENAISHAKNGHDIRGATLYVTAHPCKDCMLQIVEEEIGKVVFMDFKSHTESMLGKKQREVSEQVAKLGKVKLEKFNGNLNWLPDWIAHLEELGIFEM